MANPSGAKGNPAHKRMSNSHLKDKRAACWARGEKRKAERRAAQDKRAAVNKDRILHDVATPWQIAKHKRYVKRHAA